MPVSISTTCADVTYVAASAGLTVDLTTTESCTTTIATTEDTTISVNTTESADG